ncbi:MAG TPA: LysR family transcriptional regulator [Nitrospiraceae bacterium]|nr:LysR family transcriptional regulator [Nitrospiraceae bacterium]
MELRQLKTFQMVARLLSFNRAADALNYAQSTVSAQIRLLEEEFGVPLFNRLDKQICLTEAGQMLMQYSQKMLDLQRETTARISGWEEPHGSISIRIPQSIGTYLLPSVLSTFRSGFPKIGFNVSTCAYDTLAYELKTGITDVAFLLADSIPYAELETEHLKTEPLVIISHPNHPLAKQTAMQVRDLAGHAILLPKHDCSYKMVFEHILNEEGVDPAVFLELNSIEAIKQCVLKDVGVAMMPMMAIKQELAEKTLAILPWSQEKLETAILMIWHKDKWLSPALLSFMDIVRAELKSLDSGR